MNLNQSPTKSDLSTLLAACDDKAGHHMVWVDNDGYVQIDVIPEALTPLGYATKLESVMRFRTETLQSGNAYVGTKASQDDAWVSELFSLLTKAWAKGIRGYVECEEDCG